MTEIKLMTKAEIIEAFKKISDDWCQKRDSGTGDYVRADTMADAWDLAADFIEENLKE